MLISSLQNAPVDSTPYLLLGYGIIGGVGLIYAISLLVRQHSLRRDLQMLERWYGDGET